MPQSRQDQREAELEEMLQSFAGRCSLTSWNSFVTTLQVPPDLYPALASGRSEMIKLTTPRALSEDECKVLYDLIGGLIDTNAALREHAQHLAKLVNTWGTAFKGLESIGKQIDHFANFRSFTTEEG